MSSVQRVSSYVCWREIAKCIRVDELQELPYCRVLRECCMETYRAPPKAAGKYHRMFIRICKQWHIVTRALRSSDRSVWCVFWQVPGAPPRTFLERIKLLHERHAFTRPNACPPPMIQEKIPSVACRLSERSFNCVISVRRQSTYMMPAVMDTVSK